MCKVINTVPSLVWLRRAVRRWCSRAAASVRPGDKDPTVDTAVPAGHVAVRRWRSRAAASVRPGDKDSTVDAAVPAGHVAVRVEGRAGAGNPRRFVVRLAQLSHPAFLELLRQAEEEYGFPPGASGPLALPCDEDRLRDVLRRVSPEERRQSFSRRRRGDSRPLLRGMATEKVVS